MPTYQYACTDCAHQFEAVQKFTDASLTRCPRCAGKLRKLYGAVGVIFKGSGFYRNDNRASAGSSENASTSATSTASSDTKVASDSSPNTTTTTTAPANATGSSSTKTPAATSS